MSNAHFIITFPTSAMTPFLKVVHNDRSQNTDSQLQAASDAECEALLLESTPPYTARKFISDAFLII